MTIVNHHADHPGFAGVTGLLIGLVLSVKGGAGDRGRSGTDHAPARWDREPGNREPDKCAGWD